MESTKTNQGLNAQLALGLRMSSALQAIFLAAVLLFSASIVLGIYTYLSTYRALPDIKLEHLRQADQLAAAGDKAAVDAYNIAARLAPDDAVALSQLYATARQWDDTDASWWALKQALLIDASNPALNALAAAGYYQQQDYANSRRYYMRSIVVDQRNVDTTIGLALSEYQLGNHSTAAKWLQRAQQLAPARSDVRRYLAEVEAAGAAENNSARESP